MTNNRNGPRLYEVYLITNQVNGKRYVGKTAYSAKYRAGGHKYAGSTHMPLHRAIKKYGWEHFTVVVIYQGVDEREIGFVERAMIAEYNTFQPNGYNLTIGGDGAVGRRHSLESKAKMSKAQSGKTMSPSARAKMSAARMGRKHSAESIVKMVISKTGKSTANRGRKQSADHVAKRIASRVANGPSEKSLRHAEIMRSKINHSNPVWCLETGEMWINHKTCYNSFNDAAGNAFYAAIDRCAVTYKGLHFVSHVG